MVVHVFLGFLLGVTPQIKIEAPGGKITVRTVKEKRTPYVLLTREDPVTFSVEGPVYIRIYTRLLYMKGDREKRTYKILLQEDGKRERIYTKTTEPSPSSFYDSSPVGKWRTIPIQVPSGKHMYKLVLFESPYPVALRITPGRPPQWKSITPRESLKKIRAVEKEKLVTYYLLPVDSGVTVEVKGPSIFKVEVRSNFTPGMGKVDHFAIRISEGEKLLKSEDVSVYPSDVVRWKDKKDWIPSQKVKTTIAVPKGSHRLSVKITGSLSPQVAVRFLVEAGKGE